MQGNDSFLAGLLQSMGKSTRRCACFETQTIHDADLVERSFDNGDVARYDAVSETAEYLRWKLPRGWADGGRPSPRCWVGRSVSSAHDWRGHGTVADM